MGIYGPTHTWKIVYWPKTANAGMRGVALMEADSRQQAMYDFQQQYAGLYTTVDSCEKLLG